jgi:tetratricopeptide (TPR) repeat protein
MPWLLIAAIALAALMGCGGPKPTSKSNTGNAEVDPGEVKPKIDTRFQEKYFEGLLFKANGEGLKAYSAFEECLKFEPKNGAAHFELGRLDLDFKQDIESALTHAKASIASDKTNPWYHLLMGKILAGQGDYAEAAKSFSLVSKLNPFDLNVLYEQADAQINAKMFVDAIKTYDLIERKSGVSEELSLRKHKLYIDLQKWDQAGLELERLADQYPEVPQYWAMVAQHYQKLGKTKEAAAAMEKMLYADPNNGQAHFELSEFHARNGDEKKSYEELKIAFESREVGVDQKIGIMINYLTLTDTQTSAIPQALELLAILERVHPEEAKTHSMAGDFHYRDGKVKEALTSYHKALALDADRNLIWQQALILAHELGDWETLKMDSERALELFPNEPVFYYYNGLAYQNDKQHQEALEAFGRGKDMVVDNDALMVRFLAGIGDEYYRLSDYKKSDEAFDMALRIQPNEVYVLNNYAYFLGLRKERMEQAEQMAKYANELVPNEASYQDTYAWVLFNRGKFSEALMWIERALASDANSAELLEHYGDILYKLDRKSEALKQWKKAQELGGASEKLIQKINSGLWVE